MALHLADLYEAVASAVPERSALVCAGDRLTYAELDARANRVARHLIAAGLQVIVDTEYAPAAAAVAADDRYLIYTGGTTGAPKGALWRQEDFFYSALAGGNPAGEPHGSPEAVAAFAQNVPPISYLLAAPLMNGAAAYNLFIASLMGSTVVLERRFDPQRMLRLVEDEKIQILTVVGDAMARPIVDALQADPGGYDVSSWKVLGSGGALLSASVREQFLRLIPDGLINDGFGASESGIDGKLELGADGRPRLAPSANVRVVDEEFRQLAPGETGHIAKSGHVPLGFNDPVKTAATFPLRDGVRWVVPGDFGQRVAAVVELREGASADVEQLRAHCRESVAGYKVPALISFAAQVRRSPTGKADYRWARDVLGSAAG